MNHEEAAEEKRLGYSLATCLEAIRNKKQEFKALKAEYDDELENLQSEADKLRMEILTGQKRLPLEATDASLKA